MCCRALLLATLAVAAARVVPEPPLGRGWIDAHDDALALDAGIRFSVAVAERGLDDVRAAARAVSDPASPAYGRYLSRAEVDALAAPRAEDVAIVVAWLDRACATTTSRRGRVVTAVCTREAAEATLQTTFRRVARAATRQHAMRASAFTVPAAVVLLIVCLFEIHAARLARSGGGGC